MPGAAVSTILYHTGLGKAKRAGRVPTASTGLKAWGGTCVFPGPGTLKVEKNACILYA